MLIIGDVHARFEDYKELIRGRSASFQLGDMGIGFSTRSGKEPLSNVVIEEPGSHAFIRGNHDNPSACRDHPNYAGDFGVIGDVFFIGGSFSIDHQFRTEGIDWWRDEELNYAKCHKALCLYIKTKPRVVLSHEAPLSIAAELLNKWPHVSRTGQLFQQMLEFHVPEKWYFAHYHTNWTFSKSGCDFYCINSLHAIEDTTF